MLSDEGYGKVALKNVGMGRYLTIGSGGHAVVAGQGVAAWEELTLEFQNDPMKSVAIKSCHERYLSAPTGALVSARSNTVGANEKFIIRPV